MSLNQFAWLAFMLAELPRLFFRIISKKPILSTAHRVEKHSNIRILIQLTFQDIGYLIAIFIVYWQNRHLIFLLLLCLSFIFQSIKIGYQIKQKSAYITTFIGHNIDDFLIKPLRWFFLLTVGWIIHQPIWLLGFGIIFSQWIITRPYEEVFDVPNWFQAILILSSSLLALLFFPFDLGLINPETVRDFLMLISTVYVTYISILSALFVLIKNKNENKKEEKIHIYYTGGMILNFSYVSLLFFLCLIGLFVFGSQNLDLVADNLFVSKEYLSLIEKKQYILFGTILSLSWLVLWFTVMTAYMMLIETGKITPNFLKELKNRGRERTKR